MQQRLVKYLTEDKVFGAQILCSAYFLVCAVRGRDPQRVVDKRACGEKIVAASPGAERVVVYRSPVFSGLVLVDDVLALAHFPDI